MGETLNTIDTHSTNLEATSSEPIISRRRAIELLRTFKRYGEELSPLFPNLTSQSSSPQTLVSTALNRISDLYKDKAKAENKAPDIRNQFSDPQIQAFLRNLEAIYSDIRISIDHGRTNPQQISQAIADSVLIIMNRIRKKAAAKRLQPAYNPFMDDALPAQPVQTKPTFGRIIPVEIKKTITEELVVEQEEATQTAQSRAVASTQDENEQPDTRASFPQVDILTTIPLGALRDILQPYEPTLLPKSTPTQLLNSGTLRDSTFHMPDASFSRTEQPPEIVIPKQPRAGDFITVGALRRDVQTHRPMHRPNFSVEDGNEFVEIPR